MNDLLIQDEELSFYLAEERANVAAYFYQTYQADTGAKHFWNTNFDGEIPAEILSENALFKLKRDKAERILAAEYGLEAAISYEEICDALEHRNIARGTESDEIIYGPDEFGYMEYTAYTQAEITNKIKDYLVDITAAPEEGELYQIYLQIGSDRGYTEYEEFRPFAYNEWVNRLFDQAVSEKMSQMTMEVNQSKISTLLKMQ